MTHDRLPMCGDMWKRQPMARLGSIEGTNNHVKVTAVFRVRQPDERYQTVVRVRCSGGAVFHYEHSVFISNHELVKARGNQGDLRQHI